jgi:hypothetical protein
MTNLHVHSNSSGQTPVAGAKDRLAHALETAQQLHVNAEWLQVEAADLFTELKNIHRRPAAPNMSAAIDAVAWVDSAAANIQDELSTLVSCLEDALEG